jgi:hypothetical protein
MQFEIYKGMSGRFGAVQLSLIHPYYECPKCKARNYSSWTHPPNDNSCVGKNVYDWKNKIVFAISAKSGDLGHVLTGLRYQDDEIKLLHDPNMKSASQGQIVKTFSLVKGKNNDGSYMMYLSEKSADKKNYMIPLSKSEVESLRILLTAAFPNLLGWN